MNSMMEFRDGQDSNNHSMTKSETTLSESDLLTPSKKSGSSYSHSSRSSSSSGSSFDEDFFQLDGTTKDNTLGQDTSLNGDKDDIPIIVFSPKSQGSDVGYFGPASPGYVPGTSPDLLTPNESVKQSPPIQVMGRTDDFENSYRIPSSVFARSKSTAQQEWSVASNESLFSIHVGNNSFSREQMVLFRKSGELGKSGELVYPLTKSGQLVFPFNKYGESKSPDSSKSGEPHKESDELISYETSAPQAIPPKSANSSMNLGELGVITEAAAETMKEVFRVTAEDRYKEKTPTEGVHNSASVSHRSSASGTSIHSFAFPIRRKKCAWPSCHCCAWPSCQCCAWPSCHCCAWPSCYCFNCRRAFCYCSWPSCSCCNGSWAFCYWLNCSRCCFRSRILTGDRGKSSSAKTDPEIQLEQQPTEPKEDIPAAAPNTRGSRWFSCFSCCHICRC